MTSSSTNSFRGWYYLRMGFTAYFAFILAAINTLTVTYFLAIENYPELMAVFIGCPLLIFIGYSHYKKTKAFSSEMDVMVESNPILRRNLVNVDINLRFNITLIDLLLKLSKDAISEEELSQTKKIQNEIIDMIKNRSLTWESKYDIEYINNKIRKKSDFII